MKRWVFAAVAVLVGLLAIEGLLRLAGYSPLPRAPVTRNAELLYQNVTLSSFKGKKPVALIFDVSRHASRSSACPPPSVC